MSTTETDLTDSDLAGLDEFLHQTAKYVYSTTGSKEFAILLCKKIHAKRQGEVSSSWGFRDIINSALDHGVDRDLMVTKTQTLAQVLQLAFRDHCNDVDAQWTRIEEERAKEASNAKILHALEAEYDDEFAEFFYRRLHHFEDRADDDRLVGQLYFPSRPGITNEDLGFLLEADRECFDMDDVASALKKHVGLPVAVVDKAYEKFERGKLDKKRNEKLRNIRSHYESDAHYRSLAGVDGRAAVIPISWAAAGNTSAPPAIWGKGHDVLWAEDESLIFESSYGVGKTTAAGRLVRGLLYGEELLGQPVRQLADNQRILYLALDRPEQIVRSMLRQFTQAEFDALGARLSIWRGPLPFDAAENDHLLTDLADMHEADVIFIDSVKDAALGLSEDRAAAIYQRGRQRLLQSGRQLCELHHLTKGGDAYGSIWLNAGVGSVVRLKGAAGGPTATLTHLKSPARRLDPIQIIHDRPNGGMTAAPKQETTRFGDDAGESDADMPEPSPAELPNWVAEQGPEGITATDAANWLYGSSGRNDKVRAQRALNALCGDDGPLRYVEGSRGGDVKTPARWVGRSDD
ncbi:AAA family ATPase [Mycobacterium intracellulare subsp. intracellulare]|uniref:AAA family ATPase n=1 Tax=Mycobacterium intracellulare TaxID=1767 RepID=UPI0002F7121E|nr:AAA family ATPase [Mycobacterium intracellulare]UGU08154.1 AAA family ATPase [Mycobacterium intracellulare subsp. intracellulare]